jgi:hypothetical protein
MRPRFRRARAEIVPGVAEMHPRWAAILRGEHPLSGAQRLYRRFFSLFPSPWRCKFCNAPFRGPHSGALRWLGYTPSAKNPSICAR